MRHGNRIGSRRKGEVTTDAANRYLTVRAKSDAQSATGLGAGLAGGIRRWTAWTGTGAELFCGI